MKNSKRFLSIFFKLVVSSFLLAYILSKVDVALVWFSIKQASLHWLILAFSLHFVGLFLSACRWRLLLNAQGIDASLRALSSSYMVGFFFNTFLPTTVGGDITRAYDISRRGHLMGGSGRLSESQMQKSVAVILVERSGGIAALLFLAVIASLFGGRVFARLPSFWLIFSLFGLLLLLAIVILNQSVSGFWLKKMSKVPGVFKLEGKVTALLSAIRVYRGKRKPFFMALALSLALQINTVMHYYFIGRGLGLDISVVYFFAIVPLVILILLLPISINGIGVRENAYGFFLGQLGVGMTVSIALAWVSFALVLVFAVAGGIIYVLRK